MVGHAQKGRQTPAFFHVMNATFDHGENPRQKLLSAAKDQPVFSFTGIIDRQADADNLLAPINLQVGLRGNCLSQLR